VWLQLGGSRHGPTFGAEEQLGRELVSEVRSRFGRCGADAVWVPPHPHLSPPPPLVPHHQHQAYYNMVHGGSARPHDFSMQQLVFP
jgi:hypothetical protein